MKQSTGYVGPTILLTVAQVAISWAIIISPVLAKQALPDFGLSPVWIGAQTTIMFSAALLSTILISPLTATINSMRIAQILLLASAFGAALIASGSLPLAAIGSFLVGVGLGPLTSASSHILVRVAPQRLQPTLFSIKQSGVTLGGAIAGLAGPAIMVVWGWQASMLAAALACFATAAALQPFVRHYDAFIESKTGRRPEIIGPLFTLLRTPSLRWLTVAVVPMIFTQYGLVTFLTLYLQEDIGLSVVVAGSVFAASQIAGGVGRIVFGMIAGRMLPPLLVLALLAAMGMALAAVTALFSPDWPLFAIYGVCTLFGATAMGWNGVFIAEVARLSPPGNAGPVVGAISAFVFTSSMVGPGLFSAVLAVSTYSLAYFGCAAMSALAGSSFLRTRTVERASREEGNHT